MKICTPLWLTWNSVESSGALLNIQSLMFHCCSLQVTTLFFLWQCMYPFTLWGSAPELPAETYSQGSLEDTAPSSRPGIAAEQPTWHSKALTKMLAVLQVRDVPVSGLSFLTPSSARLWKTSGLLPFAFIIPKVWCCLQKQLPPSDLQQWRENNRCQLILSQTIFTSEEVQILDWLWSELVQKLELSCQTLFPWEREQGEVSLPSCFAFVMAV